MGRSCGDTYCIAGASAEMAIAWKPANRTETACTNPSMKRRPTGIASKAGIPMFKTRKKNQSVKLGRNL